MVAVALPVEVLTIDNGRVVEFPTGRAPNDKLVDVTDRVAAVGPGAPVVLVEAPVDAPTQPESASSAANARAPAAELINNPSFLGTDSILECTGIQV